MDISKHLQELGHIYHAFNKNDFAEVRVYCIEIDAMLKSILSGLLNCGDFKILMDPECYGYLFGEKNIFTQTQYYIKNTSTKYDLDILTEFQKDPLMSNLVLQKIRANLDRMYAMKLKK